MDLDWYIEMYQKSNCNASVNLEIAKDEDLIKSYQKILELI